MTLTSPAFTDGGQIPAKYTCEGEGVSPPLQFSDIPEDTDSLVLLMEDTDSVNGSWSHWVVWNILPGQTTFDEGSAPPEVMEGTNSFGLSGYGGPCPHNDQLHHYHFRIYALSSLLTTLDPTSRQADVEGAMSSMIIDQAELVGVFQKKSV